MEKQIVRLEFKIQYKTVLISNLSKSHQIALTKRQKYSNCDLNFKTRMNFLVEIALIFLLLSPAAQGKSNTYALLLMRINLNLILFYGLPSKTCVTFVSHQ